MLESSPEVKVEWELKPKLQMYEELTEEDPFASALRMSIWKVVQTSSNSLQV